MGLKNDRRAKNCVNLITKIIKTGICLDTTKMAIYEGEILKDGEISDDLSKEISRKNGLAVLKHGEAPYKVVIGVPHHANLGESHICENNRDSDENAASYAIVAYNALKENER